MEVIGLSHVMTYVITVASVRFFANAIRQSRAEYFCFKILSVIKSPTIVGRGL